MTSAVRFERVSRRFGEIKALDQVSFEIENGEFFSMLGPSGSGKTTSLRLIAGFDRPSEGVILIEGQNVLGVPPWERNVNTVFQDYALFPHMSVRDNVAYGLMVRGVPRAHRWEKAERMLEVVALGGLGERRPAQLSGGQRQRVALARALINEPDVLLLDEPLGALDLKLRQQMQTELKALQRRVGITFVYVTHDQGEALAMSDRIAVFNGGRIEQIGSPEDVYERPETPFVADFVGASNLIGAATAQALLGRAVPFAIRPERVRLGEGGDGEVTARGRVAAVHYLGAARRIDVELDAGGRIMVLHPSGAAGGEPRIGETVAIAWPEGAMRELHELPEPVAR